MRYYCKIQSKSQNQSSQTNNMFFHDRLTRIKVSNSLHCFIFSSFQKTLKVVWFLRSFGHDKIEKSATANVTKYCYIGSNNFIASIYLLLIPYGIESIRHALWNSCRHWAVKIARMFYNILRGSLHFDCRDTLCFNKTVGFTITK